MNNNGSKINNPRLFSAIIYALVAAAGVFINVYGQPIVSKMLSGWIISSIMVNILGFIFGTAVFVLAFVIANAILKVFGVDSNSRE